MKNTVLQLPCSLVYFNQQPSCTLEFRPIVDWSIESSKFINTISPLISFIPVRMYEDLPSTVLKIINLYQLQYYTQFLSFFSFSSANRNGTCFTASECSDTRGTIAGNCAAG